MAYNSLNLSHSLSTSEASGHPGWKHVFFKGSSAFNSDHSPTYRTLPIISGILIPFSILLSIPSLTDHWHIRTDSNHMTIQTFPNPLLLNFGMGFSMAFGILANICLVFRFAERKVLRTTWLCILFLTLHDLINISTVAIFAVQHHFHDGFTLGQPFWFTVYSTITSTATNITLIIDYFRTRDFVNSGSGLTHKQRSLVIVIIVSLSYLALGSLIQSFTLHISFIDALYFSVVSAETIGFGDIRPTSAGARVFSTFFITGGMLNIALAVAMLREVLLERVAVEFQDRVKAIRTRQREHRIRTRWRTAVKLRLRANNLPMWIVSDSNSQNDEQDWQYHHHRHWWKWAQQCWNLLRKRLSYESTDRHCRKRKHLNIEALTEIELEEAALEAGAPLADLLPPVLSRAAVGDDMEGEDDEEPVTDRGGVPFMPSLTLQDEASLKDTLVAEEKYAFRARLTVALLVFIVFWMAGAAMFMKTEKWDFGTATYFCFISFTTVGYGDFSPRTPAGRSVFVAWALVGVATMTILISILAEAYSSHFKNVIRTDIFRSGVSTTEKGGETQHIRFLESAGTVVNAGTKEEFISTIPLPVTSSSFVLPTSSKTGYRDWKPVDGMSNSITVPDYKKKSVESLQEILRHAQTLRSLIAPGRDVNINSIESTSAPQVTPQNVVGAYNIEENMQDIITAAQHALGVLDTRGLKI